MADKSMPTMRNVDSAPIVFFDGVAAFGVFAGSIEIELFARILNPNPVTNINTELITAGRLRCTALAADLQGALKMIQRSSEAMKRPHEAPN